jgi:hypothetical protein
METPVSDCLSYFCQLFAPANASDATHYFTSREIKSIIDKHTGQDAPLSEMNQSLTQMGYTYALIEQELMWYCKE